MNHFFFFIEVLQMKLYLKNKNQLNAEEKIIYKKID